MIKKFEWPKIHKTEQIVESQAYDLVESNIIDYYDVIDITDLTQDQINEITKFKDDYNEYSVLYSAFFDIIERWHMEQE